MVAWSEPIPRIFTTLRAEATTLPDLVELQVAVRAGTAPPHISVCDGLVYFKRRVYVGRDSPSRDLLLQEHHSSPTAGHPGVERTFHRLAASFFWPGMRKDVRRFVAACVECQTTKYSTQKQAGLIQPLPIPEQVWEDVSMDFVTSLPTSRGFTTIMVAVDRLSKYAHFAPLPSTFDAPKVASVFLETVVKLHGFPKRLVSDRDRIFLSDFWIELHKLSGTKLHYSTAYHPQSDGQTEVRNRGLEQYLRAFTSDRPSKWATFLPWAELALNCHFHAGLGTSPFRALYGREPPPIISGSPSASTPTDVASLVSERAALITTLRQNLARAQQRLRDTANQHRRDVQFEVGDRVWLKLQPYRQHSVARPLSAKLAKRFYGPFTITERIGPVAYRLDLPATSRIHNVFHVGLLRKFVPGAPSQTPAMLPPSFLHGRPISTPVAILDRRIIILKGIPVEQGLVHWSDSSPSEATWEPLEVLHKQFPSILLGDKEPFIPGGVDTGHGPISGQETKSTTEPNNQDQEIESRQAQETENNEPVSPRSISVRPRRQTRPPDRLGDYVRR